MADQTKGTSRSIYLDTQAAEAAMKRLQAEGDKLKEKIDQGEAAGKSMNRELAKFDQVNAKIKAVQQQLDAGLKPTLIQQQNLVRQLNNELSRMSANDPAFKAKLEDYKRQNAELATMRDKIKGVQDNQDNLGKSGLITGVVIANAMSKALEKIVELGKQAFSLALQAEGVKRAFGQLNKPEILDQLRVATRGTVSDLELMKKAVQANNFQIPLEGLGKLLEFAQRRARDTGESVDYLVDSIVTGIARKSPLILDNLGINIQRIQKEFEKTGDFAKAAFAVVNEEMVKAGPAIDTAADKVDRFKAKFANILTESGAGLIDIASNIADTFQFVLDPAAVAVKKATEEISRSLESERQAELSIMNDYNQRLATADQAGRDKIISQVKAEIETTKLLTAQAILNGEKGMEESFTRKLGMWEDYLTKIQKGVPNATKTIAGIEQELTLLNSQLKTQTIGSDQFVATRKRIAELNKELSNANPTEKAGKSDDDKVEALRKKLDDALAQTQKKIDEIKLPPIENAYKTALNDLEVRVKGAQEAFDKGAINSTRFAADIAKYQELAIAEIEAAYDKLQTKFKAEPISIKTTFDQKALEDSIDKGLTKTADNLSKKSGIFDRLMGVFQRDKKAKLDINFLNSDSNSKERLAAELAYLKEEEQARIDASDQTEVQIQAIQLEYAQKTAEAIKNYQLAKVDEIIGYAQQAVNILKEFDQAQTNRENAELQRQVKANDKKRKDIQNLARSKVLTEIEAQRQLSELDAEDAKKKEEIDKKQFERSKKLSIAQAIINGAMAVTSTLAAIPGPLDLLSLSTGRYVAIGLALATTAAQIATISGQKYEKGGIAQGASHGQGGIKLFDTRSKRVVGEMEGDEPYMILSKNFRRNNPDFIAAALDSSMNRNGARIRPFWQTRPYASLDYSGIIRSQNTIRKFETGGVFNGSTGTGTAADDQLMKNLVVLFSENQATMERLRQSTDYLNTQLQNGISSKISLTQLDDAYDQRDRIIQEATP